MKDEHPRCPLCNKHLNPTNLRHQSELDSTDVYIVQDLYCGNKKCDNYSTGETGRPLNVIKTLKTLTP